MSEVVVMPAAGNSVESCLLSEWMVKAGDTVDENTIIAAIETDKSSMEVPAGVSGTVLALLVEEGDDVPVKEPILVVGEAGEEVDPSLLSGAADEPSEEAPTSPTHSPSPSGAGYVSVMEGNNAQITSTWQEGGDKPTSPRARKLAASRGIAADALAGSGPKGRVIERDVKAAIAAGPGLTRAARASAEGFVPGTAGSGIGGRVTRADLVGGTSQTVAAPAVTQPGFPGNYTDQPLKGVRKVIAQRMMSSLENAAQLTLTATAPADGLLALRKKLKNAPEYMGLNAVTIGDLVGYAVAKTLTRHPMVNAHLTDGIIRSFDSVHLGVAVDTPRGLLVPTVQFAEAMTLKQFSDTSKTVARAAIDGSISPDLLGGGTFTVSNLGSFGIESFTPVLNEPQAGILGVGTITPRAKALPDGGVGIENRLWLSLTMDHQVYDGADGARFLKDLVEAIANIELTVMG